MSEDLGGQVILQSCGPPLRIHRPGRFSFNQLRTFVDQYGAALSCMKMCSFEFLRNRCPQGYFCLIIFKYLIKKYKFLITAIRKLILHQFCAMPISLMIEYSLNTAN